jgi:DNA polymerase
MQLDELNKIEQEILNCKRCPLYKTRNHPVCGEGDPHSKIILIGEAPGYNEDMTGHPFCGEAGKILDELLVAAEITRGEIYITNILKCRPPQNRDPKAEEIKACIPYLNRQIEFIQPKIICTMGNYATRFIFERYGLKSKIQGISKIHGRTFEIGNLFQSIKIIPIYHPAVATYNINMKGILKKDFRLLKDIAL